MAKIPVPEKKSEIIDGLTIKYHSNGETIWSKGKVLDGIAEGYWERYRINRTIKRSGYFDQGETVGEWTTYDQNGNFYKVSKLN